MRQAVLLGSPGTKRTRYLEEGAKKEGVELAFWDWDTFGLKSGLPPELCNQTLLLKIDPPVWDSCFLEELGSLTKNYEKQLIELAELGEEEEIAFLNHPLAISRLLDKRGCKAQLCKAGLPVTEALREHVKSGEELLYEMSRLHMAQVFVKPVTGSGAAGIGAFRFQKSTGHMVLYTCGYQDEKTGCLVNTKRLRRFTDPKEILSYLDSLLALDCMVERWYVKAEHRGYSYDLRAVVQDARVDFILPRFSKGPITNLHLNNHPGDIKELGFSAKLYEETEELCVKAAGCFQGLRTVGIDILLERGSLRPRIIEMNGQGDLIYQDIYKDNGIYRHQAVMMKEWLYGKE